MKKKHLQPLTPAALYARVSSDRQDVDLSVSAQLRALKDYARANGYSVAREYVDEAESGRVANRPQFREMIDEGSKPKAPFEVILVWKFSRFTRKREHAVAFKSMLRRKGIRVVSITEHADDSPTGKLMEAIIESVDEFYSEDLAQDVVRGMREAASRGFFMASTAPFGYRRIKVSDGVKERPMLEVDPATAPVVKEIFESSLRGNGLKEICKALSDRGITNRGNRWNKCQGRREIRTRGGATVLMASISVLSNRPAIMSHGECDIDAKRAGKTTGPQQLTGRAHDSGAGGHVDGSEHSPHQAHPGGLQRGGSSRTCSRSSWTPSTQRDAGADKVRGAAPCSVPLLRNQSHSPE